MRVWVVAILLSALALAGCIGGDDVPTDDAEDPADSSVPVSVNFTASSTNGTVPFDVTFSWTINGTLTNLSWALDVGEDGVNETEGATAASNHTHTFDTAGTFDVTLAVLNGNESLVETLVVEAAAGEVIPPTGGNATQGEPFFLEDADENTHEWTVGHGETTVQPDWAISSDVAQSGSNSWGTSLPGPLGYADMSYVFMTSPAIDLSTAVRPILTLAVQGGSEVGYDFLSISVVPDGGSAKELASFSGTVAEWTSVSKDLSSYAGGTVQLMFEFSSDDSCGGTSPLPVCSEGSDGPGWYVDDIVISEA